MDYTANDLSKLSNIGRLVLGGSRLGGILELAGNGSGSAEHIEEVAGVDIAAGNNIIRRISGTAILRMNSISAAAGGTVDFSEGNIASTDNALSNNILGGWATVGGFTWASKSGTNDVGGQTSNDGLIIGLALESYNNSALWAINGNMDITGNSTQNASTTNTLRFNTSGGNVFQRATLNGANTIQTGGILFTNNMGSTHGVIDGTGSIATGAGSSRNLIILQNNTGTGQLHIAAAIADSAGLNGVDKNGVGGLILTGASTYTGVTSLNGGILSVNNLSIQGYGAGNTTLVVVRPSLGRTVTLSSTAGLTIGQTVSGAELPAGVTITAINSPTTITLSNGALVTTSTAGLNYGSNVTARQGAISSTTTNGSATITVSGGTAGLSVGQSVSGTGIPANAVILSIISSTQITIGEGGVATNATAGGTNNLTFGNPNLFSGTLTSSTQSGALLTVASTLGMSVGQRIADGSSGITNGSYIVRIIDANTIEISTPVTSTGQNNTNFLNTSILGGTVATTGGTLTSSTTVGSALVTVGSTATLSVGQSVSGPGIPLGATVAAIVSDTQIVLSVAALYSGSNNLVYSGTASNLGASSNLFSNLIFNGGTLQFNGTSDMTDRGFTINSSAAIWDVGNASTTLTVGGNWGTPGIEDSFSIVKSGEGTLELLGTFISGYGLERLVVQDGTLVLKAFVGDQYIRNDVGGLTVGGGALELSSIAGRATTQNFVGSFIVNEGSSIVSVTAINNESTILNLQDANSPARIVFAPGSTVLFRENQSLTGTGEARITLAGQFGVDVQVIIPRAVYQTNADIIRPGVNNFAFVDATGYNMVGSDFGAAAHTIQGDLANWTAFMNVQDGALSGDAFHGTLASGASVSTIRFFNSSYVGTSPGASTVTITDTLTLNNGAILQTTHAGNHQNKITGGALTSSLANNDGTSADLIIHNWNPVAPLVIQSSISNNGALGRIVNLVQSGNGTTAIGGIVTDPTTNLTTSITNTYTGTTFVQGGVLRLDSVGALPTASHLRLDGGVLGLNAGDFTRALGTGANQVDWTSSGGFAAYTLDRQVNIGGVSAQLIWGANNFVPDNTSLILGAQDADKTVTFANPIDLGRKSRMIDVVSGRSGAYIDARMTGVLSGDAATLVKAGHGVLELAASNTYTGGTFLAEGTLVGTLNSAFGTGKVSVGSTTDTRWVDERLILDFRGSVFSNALEFGKANYQGISVFETTTALTSVTGPIVIGRQAEQNVFFSTPTGTTVTYNGGISGTGGFTLLGGGTMTLSGTNTYGSLTGGAGTAISGATVVRSGTLIVNTTTALSGSAIELGDASFFLTSADFVTNGASVLGVENDYAFITDNRASLGGVFLTNGNGTVDGVGGANVGPGAFYNVSNVINGHTFTTADIGKRILVKDELDSPERNGIYSVVQINADGTMNLVRVADFSTTANMRYGSQVTVGGVTYFMASPNVTSVNSPNTDPVYWQRDILNPNVTLNISNAAITSVTQAIDINANGLGNTIITSANPVTFSGNVTLQNLQTGIREIKTLSIESNTSTGAGVVFSGVIGEATPGNGATDDQLSITKFGTGIATFTGANTYKGFTTVSAGTLLINNTTGSGTGTSSVVVSSGATLGGTGAITLGDGKSMTVAAGGTLRIGNTGDTLGQDFNVSLLGNNTVTIAGALNFDIFSNLAGTPQDEADRLVFGNTGSGNTIGISAGSTLNVSSALAPAAFTAGSTWKLVDWAGIVPTGTFSNTILPTLAGGLTWDMSQFYTQGIIVVSPEPGKMVLLLLGLLALGWRRRRRAHF